MRPPGITAAICTRQRAGVLVGALDSLAAQDLPDPSVAEAVVVDNGSTDGTRELALSYANKLPFPLRVEVEQAPGLSHARNRAIDVAAGTVIAFLDDDGVADPGWLSGHLEAYRAYPEAKAVLGKIRPLWLAPRPDWLDPALEIFLTIADLGDEPFVLDYPNQCVIGANMSFEKQALVQAGKFDPDYGFGGNKQIPCEENELGARMTELGMKMVYWPQASISHGVPADRLTLKWFARRVVAQGRADAIMDAARGPRSVLAGKAARAAIIRGPLFAAVSAADLVMGKKARAARRAAVWLAAWGYLREAVLLLTSKRGSGG